MGVFETFISSLFVLIPLLIMGLIALLIFFAVKQKEQNPDMMFSPKNLLRIYIYLMLIITLAATSISTATLLNSVFAKTISTQFSYQLDQYSQPPTPYTDSTGAIVKDQYGYQTCYRGQAIKVNGSDYCFESTTIKRDFISGITLAISMVILFSIHFAGLVIINKEGKNIILSKVYAFVSLLGYGIISIVAIPTAIYQLINYWTFPATNLADYSRAIPGQPLAIAIAATPIWIYFLYNAIKMSMEKKD
jgi:hypothetical protein